jgi:hypothetical protein
MRKLVPENCIQIGNYNDMTGGRLAKSSESVDCNIPKDGLQTAMNHIHTAAQLVLAIKIDLV